MALFSIVMYYEGGSYVAQARARNPTQAVRKWAHQFDPSFLSKRDIFAREDLIREIENLDDRPVPLKETVNVWTVSASPRADCDIAIIKIVKTVVPT